MAWRRLRPFPVERWLLCIAAVAAVAVATVGAFNEGNGIAFTPGAYLALVCCVLLLAGSLVLAFDIGLPRWAGRVMAVLLLLDILGTALAAYLLQATLLLVALAVAGLGWLLQPAVGADRHGGARPAATGSGA